MALSEKAYAITRDACLIRLRRGEDYKDFIQEYKNLSSEQRANIIDDIVTKLREEGIETMDDEVESEEVE